MMGRKKPTTIVKVFVFGSLIFAVSAGAVHAADLPNPSAAPPSPVPEAAPHWYAKLGALGALDQSWSSLFAQQVAGVVVPGIGLVPVSGFGPQVSLVGRGATYSSVFTASLQAGYFFTPNWSLEVSSGVPLWLTIKITGFSATPPFSGAVLGKLLPGAVPVTGVYHFTQFGVLQPYLGGGIVPSFAASISRVTITSPIPQQPARNEETTGYFVTCTWSSMNAASMSYDLRPHQVAQREREEWCRANRRPG